jgi:hypothetical protein
MCSGWATAGLFVKSQTTHRCAQDGLKSHPNAEKPTVEPDDVGSLPRSTGSLDGSGTVPQDSSDCLFGLRPPFDGSFSTASKREPRSTSSWDSPGRKRDNQLAWPELRFGNADCRASSCGSRSSVGVDVFITLESH